jgi:nitrite reductase/ring-hydroxylating ferredoxin subunit
VNWIKALPETDLPNGERTVVDAGERSILLIHHEGQIYALQPRCPHMGGPLEKGRIETTTAGPTLTCPWHHSAFDLRSGDVQAWSPWPPAVGKMLGALRRERALTIYPVKVEEGTIWVQVPDDGPQTTDDE